METPAELLARVVDRLAPVLAEAFAGRAQRVLIWIAVDERDDRCAIHLLSPPSAILAELAGSLPPGETSRLAGCYPELAIPILVTSRTHLRRSWLTLRHQPGPTCAN
jgi:hypothetical protein